MNPLNDFTIERNAIAVFQECGCTHATSLDIGLFNDHPVRHDYGEIPVPSHELTATHLADLAQ